MKERVFSLLILHLTSQFAGILSSKMRKLSAICSKLSGCDASASVNHQFRPAKPYLFCQSGCSDRKNTRAVFSMSWNASELENSTLPSKNNFKKSRSSSSKYTRPSMMKNSRVKREVLQQTPDTTKNYSKMRWCIDKANPTRNNPSQKDCFKKRKKW